MQTLEFLLYLKNFAVIMLIFFFSNEIIQHIENSEPKIGSYLLWLEGYRGKGG